jgi:predicted dehydrogenase
MQSNLLRVAVVGLGKMGLSHFAMINAHPAVRVEAVCDASSYVTDVLHKYTGVRTYADFDALLREVALDAVIIATPPTLHVRMVRTALSAGLHVFCEKPFCLDVSEGEELARMAYTRALVNQVGYHNRFIASFQEVRRLLDAGAIGKVTHALAEAYGPVVLKPSTSTWRTQSAQGGSCLYDYAAHPLNLVNWYFGAPYAVGGSILGRMFSEHTDDEVFGSLYFADGKSAQLSVSWSDESYRKMSTSITIWGSAGRIYADRQECRVYLRDLAHAPAGYRQGWNARYTTELTEPVWFYIRGEEYSRQLEYFVECIRHKRGSDNINSFAEALVTDRAIAMMLDDAARGPALRAESEAPRRRSFFGAR